jgi:hypothetical protein
MAKHRLADLFVDTNIYPRVNMSAVNINKLMQAIQSGCDLPPIAVEMGSGRILDGVCRWKALIKVFGDDATVEVVEHECRDDNDAFLTAIELNSAHGMQLTSHDLAERVIRAEQRGITLEMLARVAHVPLEKIERRLTENTASVRTLGMEGKVRVDLKPPMRALAGRELSEQQVATNRVAGGMSTLYYIEFLRKLIDADLWTWGSANERNALHELFIVMQRVITNAA